MAETDSIVTQEPATPASDPSHRTTPSCQALAPLLSLTREVESGQKTSGHPLTAQPPGSAPGLPQEGAPGTGQAENYAGSSRQGTWGQGAALPDWGPCAGSWRAVRSPGPPPPRGHFHFLFSPPKQDRPGQGRQHQLVEMEQGLGGQKDWPWRRKGAQQLPVPVPLRVNLN